ncbi:MAG: VacJ family lipoprotein [Deltaproteobacteria bacterium]|nr:VacJ family lipoprotein [Candidatus Anaeroferrophillus wilburensis]MBN2888157.1 VacJ family lipoprotein [Deltaproteobacteria bacterium]
MGAIGEGAGKLLLLVLLTASLLFGVFVSVPAVSAAGSEAGSLAEMLNDEYDDDDVVVADPLEAYNRLMFTFNDRLYFWVLKPVATGYGKVTPEPLRIGIRNFFTNLSAPVRMLNCLLQGKFAAFGQELSRFLLNSTVGIAGLMDPASYDGMKTYDEDFSQTLGVYGLGNGCYLVWPVFGPSTIRGTVGMVGDYFTDPPTWIFMGDFTTGAAVTAGEKINTLSLTIGDYEDMIKAVLDPYIAVRNAFYQQQLRKVEQ